MQYKDIAVSFWSAQSDLAPHVLFTMPMVHLSLSSIQMPIILATLSAVQFCCMPSFNTCPSLLLKE